MTDRSKPTIGILKTGVAGFDQVIGGGIPEYSFNIISGTPGTGKTTLAHQIMFANASVDTPALYITVMGEPPIKMLRYQQQFSFFDAGKIGSSVHFVNLNEEAINEGLERVLERIIEHVERRSAALVVVDSFRSLARTAQGAPDLDLAHFVERLSLRLTTWQATTFLIGEYAADELPEVPVASIADGIFILSQELFRNSMVRRLQVLKIRGLDPQPGLHTVRISAGGLEVFPRMLTPVQTELKKHAKNEFVSTGVPGLDDLLGGGTLRGNVLMLAGPSGSGKTTVATQFIAEGVKRGEPGVIALFEETPPKYAQQAKGFGFDMQQAIDEGKVELVYLRPLDLSVDETLYAIQLAVDRVKARRVVIDSLTGLEIALAPPFKEDVRESLYRLLGALTGGGVSVMMTIEVTESYTELRFSPHAVSFMTHDIVLQRYVEINGELQTVITVVKTRGRGHKRELRSYEITDRGLTLGDVIRGYEGVITAVPRFVGTSQHAAERNPKKTRKKAARKPAAKRPRRGR
jgi:circadian clock protein KaiC